MVLTVHTPVSNSVCYVGRVGIHREKCRGRGISIFISYSTLVDTVEHTVFSSLESVLKDKKKKKPKNSNEFKLITT